MNNGISSQKPPMRAVNAVSLGELQRRWTAVRRDMRSRDIDALVIQNSSDWVGGYIRWFSNQPATNGYSSSVVFPIDGGMSFIEQGPFDGCRNTGNEETQSTGIARRLTTPSYPSVRYTGSYDADLAVGELTRLGVKRVGLVAPGAMYHSFGQHLVNSLAEIDVVDATDFVDRIKAIKSSEERDCILRVAAMQDEVMVRVRDFVRPGLKDFEIAAYAQYVGQQLGSEQGIFLCSSAPLGHAAGFRPRSLQGRTLERGDVYSLLVENNGAGGFYAELSRMFVLGKIPEELNDAHTAVIEAQRFALSLLTPGASPADIFARHNEYLRRNRMPEERRLSVHGMGYDMVERPLIRQDEDMAIEEHMAIVCHPGILNERMFVHNTDLYLIEAHGPSGCLHQTPKKIFQID
ncbi:MAG TPA: M24 family metallopeptidase [Steroidobacteraceae bacterium]|jgi:Xaa-Pro aminopeptidase|nr:M24 family metallopeptidase [Steroidobacteraceae bacterium]